MNIPTDFFSTYFDTSFRNAVTDALISGMSLYNLFHWNFKFREQEVKSGEQDECSRLKYSFNPKIDGGSFYSSVQSLWLRYFGTFFVQYHHASLLVTIIYKILGWGPYGCSNNQVKSCWWSPSICNFMQILA